MLRLTFKPRPVPPERWLWSPDLGKRFEKAGSGPLRKCRARCRSRRRGSRSPERSTVKITAPVQVNFMALPSRLNSTWRSRWESPQTTRGRSGAIELLQPQIFFAGAGREKFHRGMCKFRQIEFHRMQFELAGFDFRQVQHVIDQRQQMLGRLMNDLHAVALLVAQRLVAVRESACSRGCR